jgi:hypothetical protein
MSYIKAAPQPPLLDGEVAIQLDDGELIAVSVKEEWQSNGGGVHLLAMARWIQADGTQETAPDGTPIVATFSNNFGPLQIDEHGMDALRREALLVILGEDSTATRPVLVDSTAPDLGSVLSLADDVALDPAAATAPLLSVTPEIRLNSSIRNQMTTVQQVRAPTDLDTLLGL